MRADIEAEFRKAIGQGAQATPRIWPRDVINEMLERGTMRNHVVTRGSLATRYDFARW